jgi:hypothetical protein
VLALGLLGVDTEDLGASCYTEFRSVAGRVRVRVNLSEAPRKPHTARQVQQAFILGKVFHHAPAPLRVVRDVILDRTPLLQKVVGESSPGEIIAQLSAIDEAEQRFQAIRAAKPTA